MTNPDEKPNKRRTHTSTRENQKYKRPKRSQNRQHSTLHQGNGRKDGGNTSNQSDFKSKCASDTPRKKSKYQVGSEHHRKHRPQAKTSASYQIQNPSKATVAIIENGSRKNPSLPVIRWYSPNCYVPLAKEKDLIDVLLRWKKKERGMLSRQPDFRLNQIRKKCHSVGMSMIQACSLRRHHMKLLNPSLSMHVLGLGTDNNVRESAAEFEKAIASFLTKSKVQYKSEEDQKKLFKGTPCGPTPDFVLEEPVCICTAENQSTGTKPNNCSNVPAIKWIEAKMFYGASTIPHDNKSAVGRILLTARKYVKHFGNGVMVFSYGCGDTLARELAEIGVLALDAHPVDLRSVEESQRKWCGGKDGEILP